MKFFKLRNLQQKKGYLPFSGTPHVNAQRHLRGAGRNVSKQEMEKSASHLLSINHVFTKSQYLVPAVRDQIEIRRRSSLSTRW